jgi:hypothetical protein
MQKVICTKTEYICIKSPKNLGRDILDVGDSVKFYLSDNPLKTHMYLLVKEDGTEISTSWGSVNIWKILLSSFELVPKAWIADEELVLLYLGDTEVHDIIKSKIDYSTLPILSPTG